MERGMWESNLRMQFNFPTHDTLEVAKEVDTSNVNPALEGFFDNVSANFSIKNMVTHYGTQDSRVDRGDSILQSEIRDYGSAYSSMSMTAAFDAKYTKNAARRGKSFAGCVFEESNEAIGIIQSQRTAHNRL